MEPVDAFLAWLTSLPPLALYLALAGAAALENIFPPVPADTIVAFGSFLAARGDATPVGAFLATWLGNIAGAMLVYAAARRFGAGWLHRRIRFFGGEDREHRLEQLYRQRGVLALFLSRFLPGVRALVPPFAGALRVPAASTFTAIALASGVWYGIVTIVAYRVGADWESLQHRLGAFTRGAGLVAVVIVLIAGAAWYWRRRRSRTNP
ncbi:MAG TPA: DedA family protein [Gemmatimonadaceae bacterium]|nr:DedA family protein [Gemmatimonadaceae bacterium]